MKYPLFFLSILALILPGFGEESTAMQRLSVYVPPIRGILTEASQIPATPSHLLFTQADKVARVPIYRNGFSQPVELTAGVPVRISRPRLGEGYEDLLTLEIPKTWGDLLMLLEPSGPAPFKDSAVKMVEISEAVLARKHIVFFNELDNPVELTLDERNHALDAGQRVSVAVEPGRHRIFLQEIDGTRGRRYTGAVFSHEDRGNLVLIAANAHSARRMEVMSLSGLPPDAKEIHLIPEDELEELVPALPLPEPEEVELLEVPDEEAPPEEDSEIPGE